MKSYEVWGVGVIETDPIVQANTAPFKRIKMVPTNPYGRAGWHPLHDSLQGCETYIKTLANPGNYIPMQLELRAV